MWTSSCQETHQDDHDPPTDTSIISSGRLNPNLARLRYTFQIVLSLLVILFSMGCVAYDLGVNGTMTAISNVAWPSITFVLGLHFNIKKDAGEKPPPRPSRINIVQDPPHLPPLSSILREDLDH